jgi:hypothetical protein
MLALNFDMSNWCQKGTPVLAEGGSRN